MSKRGADMRWQFYNLIRQGIRMSDQTPKSDSWGNPLDGIVQVRAERALRTLAEAGREALGFYEQGHFDAAQLEVDRARRAVRVLDEIRREQKREAQ